MLAQHFRVCLKARKCVLPFFLEGRLLRLKFGFAVVGFPGVVQAYGLDANCGDVIISFFYDCR